jgi:hypothetical protein
LIGSKYLQRNCATAAQPFFRSAKALKHFRRRRGEIPLEPDLIDKATLQIRHQSPQDGIPR